MHRHCQANQVIEVIEGLFVRKRKDGEDSSKLESHTQPWPILQNEQKSIPRRITNRQHGQHRRKRLQATVTKSLSLKKNHDACSRPTLFLSLPPSPLMITSLFILQDNKIINAQVQQAGGLALRPKLPRPQGQTATTGHFPLDEHSGLRSQS